MTLVALAACLPPLGLCYGVAAGRDSSAQQGAEAGAATSGALPLAAATASAADVLRGWDRARSRAFAHGDVAALRSLYARRSRAGASDVRLLRAYLDRGLRVEGMAMQVLALEVLGRTDRQMRLRVTDRLADAVAVGEGTRTSLPRDRASTRVLVLRRTKEGGQWKVASVSDSARRPAGR